MRFRIIKLVDGGAYGDIYEGHDDDLDRPVAIKVIRPSVGDSEFLLNQAKALARIDSPNVVRVIAIAKVVDPGNEERVPAIVMDWLDGKTLQALLHPPALALSEARRIGLGVIDGLTAIHAQDISHSDLHAGNVIVGKNSVKVIDILYFSTLANKSTMSKRLRFQGDYADLQRLLHRLLQHSDLPVSAVDQFIHGLKPESTIADIRESFEQATDPSVAHRAQLSQAIDRVSDSEFVDTPEYANALSADTPDHVVRPLILEMIKAALATPNHQHYLTLLWKRLAVPDRDVVTRSLATAIDREVPGGNWLPHIAMLAAFRRTGWNSLPDTTRLRLENAITKDVLNGYIDIHRRGENKAGRLGAYAAKFCYYFTQRDALVANLLERLQQGWFTQNYVATHFMSCLPDLAETTTARRKFIEALGSAYRNDSRILKQNFDELPEDWRQEIIAKAKGD
jgi:tRNA A-37 threonylcarbamoyl transferase component Bud32